MSHLVTYRLRGKSRFSHTRLLVVVAVVGLFLSVNICLAATSQKPDGEAVFTGRCMLCHGPGLRAPDL